MAKKFISFDLWQKREHLRSNIIDNYLKLIWALCFNSILFKIRFLLILLNGFSFIGRKFTTILFTPFTHCLGLNNHIFWLYSKVSGKPTFKQIGDPS